MSPIRHLVAALTALSIALPAAPVLRTATLAATALPAAVLLAPAGAEAGKKNRARFHQGGRHQGRPRHHGRPAIHTRPAHRPGYGYRPTHRPGYGYRPRRVDIHHHYHDRRRGRFAAGVAVGAASTLALGAIVSSLPPRCSGVSYGGVFYQRCGGTWYAPRYDGPEVVYVVVPDPRR
jgi:hypothetical protein